MSMPVARSPAIKGWCPGALRPMESGDGWVVRVRPRGGRLSQQQVAGIAALAAAHGNGWLDLSSRANLQIRGVSTASHTPLIHGLRALGLLDDDEICEARRNVMVSPFAGTAGRAIAAALEALLTGSDAPDLPAKFGFAVDTGFPPVLRSAPADIRIERTDDTLVVRAQGSAVGARVTPQTAADRVLDLARWFLASGGVAGGRGRMAAHLAAGAKPPEDFCEIAGPIGDFPIPQPGRHPDGFLAALAFGQIRSETLAQLAERGALRLTPWRMLMIEGLTAAPDLPDLITDPDAPLLRVVACTGTPGCLQGLQPTRTLARALALQVPHGKTLHVSGCAKGCAHPGVADFCLVGAQDGYHLARNAKATDAKGPALSPGALLQRPDLLFGTTDAA